MGQIVKLTVKGVAEIYDVTERTVYNWIEEGKLTAFKDPGGRAWLIVLDVKVYEALTSAKKI